MTKPSLFLCCGFRLWGLLPILLLGCTLTAHADDRVALVVGNSAYRGSPLQNPRNDADAMAKLLQDAGFSVDKQLDTDLTGLQAAVDRFGTAIRDPKVKFGLFYYAGHGLQQDWRNYLVPVSANIRASADVPKQTVDVSSLLRYMEQAQGRSFLVVLDACRDDPFAGSYKPPAKGLSQFDAPVGSLLAYATAPGSVAQDGDGKNGLYTSNLLREFAVRGTRIEDAFKRVRLNVRLASKGQQIPWESTSLEEDIYLFPVAHKNLSEAEKDQLLEQEMAAWLVVKSSADPHVLGGFIRQYPSGSASELAQSRLSRLLVAMAAQENQRLKGAAQSAAQGALELVEREAAAQARVVQAEQQRLGAEKAEQTRVQLAQQEADRQEALRVQAQRLAAERTEAARVAAERVRAAELQAQRLATEEAQRQAAVQAQRVAAETQATALALQQAQQLSAQTAALAAVEREALRLDGVRVEAARHELARTEAARVEALRLAAVVLAEAAVREQALAQAELQQVQAQAVAQAEQVRVQAQLAAQNRIVQAELAAVQQREALRLVEERRAAQVLVASTVSTAEVFNLPATPFYKGYAEHQRRYSVGDEFNIRVIDQSTKLAKPLVMRVTQVDMDAERVVFNDGEFVSDLMGNTTTNQRGLFSTPRQFYPADLFVGKKWSTRFKQSRPGGVKYTYLYDLKVVGKESITVPAGTFEAFKIEAKGFNQELGAYLERNIWVAPGVNADIAHEIKVRLRNGWIEQNDRQELVSLVQAKR